MASLHLLSDELPGFAHNCFSINELAAGGFRRCSSHGFPDFVALINEMERFTQQIGNVTAPGAGCLLTSSWTAESVASEPAARSDIAVESVAGVNRPPDD